MSRLTWGAVGERIYETGVDRGVLYIENHPGVVWNGLVSVTESPTGGEARPYYIDGIKYLNRPASEEFVATIQAYTYPEEFGACDGTSSVKNGLFTTQQRRKPFNLVYRSRVGNDVDGTDHGYKIHIVYDALAEPSSHAHATLSDSVDPFNFSWEITTRPPALSGRRPTSHFVIDSRKTPTDLLIEIEDILYGNDEMDPRLPSVHELVYIFENYNTGVFDARFVGHPYYNTFDGGMPPTTVQTSTINGGAP